MRSEEQFWEEVQVLKNRDAILKAEQLDLTREQTAMIAKADVYSRIKESLSPSGAKLFLAGMYLQGSLLLEAERAYYSVLGEVERRDLEAKTKKKAEKQLPTEGKSRARILRGL
tara:strand:- start:219 stop:560 length:342 start_codon:yes stop_codon:yes gene_type:complete